MIGDFHIHSYYSKDSINTPKTVLRIARLKGLDTIAVTDHDTIKGGVATKKCSDRTSQIKIIVGSEILTDIGDIIGLHLTEEIKSTEYLEVIEEIHAQGGLVVLPHPYRGHKDIDEVSKMVDFIEVWNSRNNAEQNEKALLLSERRGIRKIVGSDAHLPTEIGNSSCVLTDSFDFEKMNSSSYATRINILCSIGIRRIRSKINWGMN